MIYQLNVIYIVSKNTERDVLTNPGANALMRIAGFVLINSRAVAFVNPKIPYYAHYKKKIISWCM